MVLGARKLKDPRLMASGWMQCGGDGGGDGVATVVITGPLVVGDGGRRTGLYRGGGRGQWPEKQCQSCGGARKKILSYSTIECSVCGVGFN